MQDNKIVLESLHKNIEEFLCLTKSPKITNKNIESKINNLSKQLEQVSKQINPVHCPELVFDPCDSKNIQYFSIFALLSQTIIPLNSINPFCGSGIYAIYYKGNYSLYNKISNTETPIYIGKSSPLSISLNSNDKKNFYLMKRLEEHKKNISKAESTLNINDFYCRWILVKSGWESILESYMINFFNPIWNKETKLIFGFGKHGDSTKTRLNKRSPWDTLHPSREWASDTKLKDKKTISQIENEVNQHFKITPIFKNKEDILNIFYTQLNQSE